MPTGYMGPNGQWVEVANQANLPARGTPEFMQLALDGGAPGVSRIVISGFNADVDTATVPEAIWGGDGLIPRPAADEAWEIVGGLADTATGTGARTVSLTTLSGNYVSVTQTVTMNGETAAPLSGLHRFANIGLVLTSGSAGKPSQPLVIRVAGGGPVRAYIGVEGVLNQAKFTVPAGFRLAMYSALVGIRPDAVTAQSAVLNNIVVNSAGRELAPLRIPLFSAGHNLYRHELFGGLVAFNTIQPTNEVTMNVIVSTTNNTPADCSILCLLYEIAKWG